MSQHALYECFAKLKRAKLHMKNLHAQLKPDGKQGFGLAFGIDYERQQIVVLVHPQRRAMITHWAILTGEIMHQLRSSLDHAIRHLVIANGEASKERETAFPVCTDEGKYPSQTFKIDGVSDAAAKIIRELQPFGPDHAKHPLYVLNELWNRDKHRFLNFGSVRLLALQVVAMDSGHYATQIVKLPDATDRDGTELVREPLKQPLEPTVQIVFELLAAFTFIDAGPATGRGFPEYLTELIQFTEDALTKLAATIGAPITENLSPVQKVA